MPQGREDAEARIRTLEERRKALQRQRQVAEQMWVGGSRERKKRIDANATVLKAVEDELTKLQSGQGRVRQRQQTLSELTGKP